MTRRLGEEYKVLTVENPHWIHEMSEISFQEKAWGVNRMVFLKMSYRMRDTKRAVLGDFSGLRSFSKKETHDERAISYTFWENN